MLRALEQKIAEDGEELVFMRIAEGERMHLIAARYDVSKAMIYRWIHMTPEREKAWGESKKIRAHSAIEEGQEILDNPAAALTSATATMAKERANWRKWYAGILNREEYGERPAGVEINLNVSELHLDALRVSGGMKNHLAPPPAAQAVEEIEEAEVLAIESGAGEAGESETGGVLEELKSA